MTDVKLAQLQRRLTRPGRDFSRHQEEEAEISKLARKICLSALRASALLAVEAEAEESSDGGGGGGVPTMWLSSLIGTMAAVPGGLAAPGEVIDVAAALGSHGRGGTRVMPQVRGRG